MAELANQYGINLGNILSTAEDIKGARQRREINSMKLEAVKRDAEETDAMTEFMANNPDASMREVFARFPRVAAPVIKAFGEASETDRSLMVNNAMGAVQIIDRVLAAPEDQRPSLYQRVRESLPSSIRQQVPQQYNETQMLGTRNFYIQMVGGKDLLVKQEANKLAMGLEDYRQTGRERLQGMRAANQNALADKRFAAQSGTARNQVETQARLQLYQMAKNQNMGSMGLNDFLFKDPADARKVQKALALAVKDVQSGGSDSVSEAVLKAWDLVMGTTDDGPQKTDQEIVDEIFAGFGG